MGPSLAGNVENNISFDPVAGVIFDDNGALHERRVVNGVVTGDDQDAGPARKWT
jgi:hypothetical protein